MQDAHKRLLTLGLMVIGAGFIAAPAAAVAKPKFTVTPTHSSRKRRAPSLITPPVLTGTAQQGLTLTLTVGTWKHSSSQDGIWMDCNRGGRWCRAIPGQSAGGLGESYTLAQSDVGHTILVLETATGPGGSRTVESAPTAVVTGLPAPVHSGQTPFPVIQGTLPPVSVLDSIPYQLTSEQQCDTLTANLPGTSTVCTFMDTFGPTGVATPAPLAKDVEQTQLCDDVATVINTISNEAMSTQNWHGAGEYYFDSDNQSGQSPGPLGNCYMLINTDPGSTGPTPVLTWELVANEDGVPTNPLSSISAFVNSIPISAYQYEFPYPTDP